MAASAAPAANIDLCSTSSDEGGSSVGSDEEQQQQRGRLSAGSWDDSEDAHRDDVLHAPPLRARLAQRAQSQALTFQRPPQGGVASGLLGSDNDKADSVQDEAAGGDTGWVNSKSEDNLELQWAWKSSNSSGAANMPQWTAYSGDVTLQIEEAYQRFREGGDPTLQLAVPRRRGSPRPVQTYVLDFLQHIQAPVGQPHRTRDIRRHQRRPLQAVARMCVCTSDKQRSAVYCQAAEFGSQLVTLDSTRAVLAEPALANRPLQNAGAITGRVAVIVRGANTFVEKARFAQEAGARAAIFVNSDNNPFPAREKFPGEGNDITIACVCIGRDAGRQFMGGNASAGSSTKRNEQIQGRKRGGADIMSGHSLRVCITVAPKNCPVPALKEYTRPDDQATASVGADVSHDESAEESSDDADIYGADLKAHQRQALSPSSSLQPLQPTLHFRPATSNTVLVSPGVDRDTFSGCSTAHQQQQLQKGTGNVFQDVLTSDSDSSGDDGGGNDGGSNDSGGGGRDAAQRQKITPRASVPTNARLSVSPPPLPPVTSPVSESEASAKPKRKRQQRNPPKQPKQPKRRRVEVLDVLVEPTLFNRPTGVVADATGCAPASSSTTAVPAIRPNVMAFDMQLQLAEEKTLKVEKWALSEALHLTVPYTMLWACRVTSPLYKRAAATAAEVTNVPVVSQRLLHKIGAVVPLDVFVALVDAGALQGHIEATRKDWHAQDMQLRSEQQETDETHVDMAVKSRPSAHVSTGRTHYSECKEVVVHYVLEGLPQGEKEREQVVKQLSPASQTYITGGGHVSLSATASRRANKVSTTTRIAAIEAALLWLSMEAEGVIVQHTVGIAATVEYLSRLCVKLAANMGQTIVPDALASIVKWSPDFATLKLLGGGQDQPWQTRTYFAMLCAIPGCTARHAIAVIRKFPSLRELIVALNTTATNVYKEAVTTRGPSHSLTLQSMSKHGAALILQDLQVELAHGGTRRLGPVVSERICIALTCTDRDRLLRESGASAATMPAGMQ